MFITSCPHSLDSTIRFGLLGRTRLLGDSGTRIANVRSSLRPNFCINSSPGSWRYKMCSAASASTLLLHPLLVEVTHPLPSNVSYHSRDVGFRPRPRKNAGPAACRIGGRASSRRSGGHRRGQVRLGPCQSMPRSRCWLLHRCLRYLLRKSQTELYGVVEGQGERYLIDGGGMANWSQINIAALAIGECSPGTARRATDTETWLTSRLCLPLPYRRKARGV
jgi:hypothetical protein